MTKRHECNGPVPMDATLVPVDACVTDGDYKAPAYLASMAWFQIQPIIVVVEDRRDDPDHDPDDGLPVIVYRVYDGRRRLAKARELGWREIKAFICSSELEAVQVCQLVLAANAHAPNHASEARALAKMKGLLGGDDEAFAEAVKLTGLAPSQVKARLRIAGLQDEILSAVERGDLARGAGNALASLKTHAAQERAIEIAEEAKATESPKRKAPTVDQVRRAVRRVKYEEHKRRQPPLATPAGKRAFPSAGTPPVTGHPATVGPTTDLTVLASRLTLIATGDVEKITAEERDTLNEAAVVLERIQDRR